MKEGETFGRGGPTLEQFRTEVLGRFGRNLEKATPANVREFMDRFHEGLFRSKMPDSIELNEPKTTWEEIWKDFFVQVLERPTDEALITLWTLAFELSFYVVEQHAADRLQGLFADGSD